MRGIEALHKNRNNKSANSILCQGPIEGAELYQKNEEEKSFVVKSA